MIRRTGVLALILLVAGCRDYDRYSRVEADKGLVPADVFARYGSEQAQAIAIGRALGTGHAGIDSTSLAKQVEQAAEYARKMPGVADVQVDVQAFLLTVTFKSGWKKAIVPINDGVPADQTPGIAASH